MDDDDTIYRPAGALAFLVVSYVMLVLLVGGGIYVYHHHRTVYSKSLNDPTLADSRDLSTNLTK